MFPDAEAAVDPAEIDSSTLAHLLLEGNLTLGEPLLVVWQEPEPDPGPDPDPDHDPDPEQLEVP